MVTSRNCLAGLAIHDGAGRLTLGTLPEPEAVALLRAVTSGYRPEDDPEKLAELARLCARLPLALRIAAERAVGHPHMSLDELVADLRDQSALWDALSTGSDADADAVRRSSPGLTGRCRRKLPECSGFSACTRVRSSVFTRRPRWLACRPGRPGGFWTTAAAPGGAERMGPDDVRPLGACGARQTMCGDVCRPTAAVLRAGGSGERRRALPDRRG